MREPSRMSLLKCFSVVFKKLDSSLFEQRNRLTMVTFEVQAVLT